MPISLRVTDTNPKPSHGLRIATAAFLAVSGTVLVFLELLWHNPRHSAPTSLYGWDRLEVQTAVSIAVGLLMLTALLLVNGVVMKRLQFAVVASLAAHLVLLALTRHMELGVDLGLVADRDPTEEETLLTLPDYGGLEAEATNERWDEVRETETPQNTSEDINRQETELDRPTDRQPPDPQQQRLPDEALDMEAVDSTDPEVQPDQTEIDRQEITQPTQSVEPMEAERVNERRREVELQESDMELNRQQAELQPQQNQFDAESNRQPVEAAELQARVNEPNPDARFEASSDFRSRSQAEALEITEELPDATAPSRTIEPEATERQVALPRTRAAQPIQDSLSSPQSQAEQAAATSAAITSADSRGGSNPELNAAVSAAAMDRASSSLDGANIDADSPSFNSASSGRTPELNAAQLSSSRATSGQLPGSATGNASATTSLSGGSVSSAVLPNRADSLGSGATAGSASGGSGRPSLGRSGLSGAVAATGAEESINLEQAGGGSGPQISARDLSSGSGRSQRSRVPSSRSATTVASPGLSGPRLAASTRTGVSSGRNSGADAPSMGAAAGSGGGTTGRSNAQVTGVGGGNETVRLPSRGGSSGTGQGGAGGGLLAGPRSGAGGGVGRRSTGLPASSTRSRSGVGTGDVGTGSGNSNALTPGGARGLGNLRGGGSGPSARLASGTGSGRSAIRSRAALSHALPGGAIDAEQSGSLVIAGPQADRSGSNQVTGPRSAASLGRRRVALPGGGFRSGSTTSGSSGRPIRSRVGGSSRRSAVQSQAPSLPPVVRRVVRQAASGRSAAVDSIAPAFRLRIPSARGRIAESMGGSPASEAAVEAGLKWLASHQSPDGQWSIHQFHHQCKDHQCSEPGSFQSDTAATGLALLAFLGAGHTHQSGEYQTVVFRALQWLVQNQKTNGDLFTGEAEFVWLYSHGMAAIAICEAYGMTKDSELRSPAQRALQFIVQAQHPTFGGWRYRPQFESDTSVSGWQLMALKSGEMAGLRVSESVYDGVTRWLDKVQESPGAGKYAYHPTRPVSLAMTAEALLMRQYLGISRNNGGVRAGADYLRDNLPDLQSRDAYYWYYATQFMFHMQGDHWRDWNGRLRDMLVNSQVREGGSAGSWSPTRPFSDRWSSAGGRLYLTCLHLLTLEVYYRHLPLYQQLEE